MNVYINFLLWTTHVDKSFFPLFKELKDRGYDGVEIPVMDGDYDHYRDMKVTLDELGLEASTSTFMGIDECPMSSDPDTQVRALAKLKDNIDKAHILGAKTLIGPLYAAHKNFELEDNMSASFERSASIMKEAARYAQNKGVTLCMEFLNRFEIILLNCAKDSARYCDLVDEPNVAILYDTHHAHIEERSIEQAFIDGGKHIKHIHFSENHRGICGDGLVDWASTVTELKKMNYSGNIVIEAFADDVEGLREGANRWRPLFDDKLGMAKECLEFTHKIIL